MPSADQVPVKSTHSMMLWPMWVVLIAGSTGSALRAVRPPNPSHHIGCPMRSRSRRERSGFFVAFAPSRDAEKLLDTMATDRRDDPELGQVRADGVDHRGLLADE